MDRRVFLRTAGASILGTMVSGSWAADDRPPNIVFFLVDDLGWADVGCYGSSFHKTPHIDRLAEQGVRFTNAYAACPVCSPTRASLLTGKYPARVGITDWIPGHVYPKAPLRVPEIPDGLPLNEQTVAVHLRERGYRTGIFGKWHLGKSPKEPAHHGFDVNFGADERGQPPSYFWPYNIPGITEGKPGEYLTDRLTDEAVKFIETSGGRLFFLYFAHYTVHTPLQAKEDLIAKYKSRVRPGQPQNNPVYAAMIESLDESVDRIVATLDRLHLAENTVVIFTSDNGGHVESTSNAPLRAGKGTLYEGGIREPLIIRWPNVIQPGTVNESIVSSPDFLPTLLDMAGAAIPEGLDGISFLSALRDRRPLPDRAVYWHYPHYHPGGAHPGGAIRHGKFKLIEHYETGRTELYDLEEDLSEQVELSERMPENSRQLLGELRDWRARIGAKMPAPNPDYDPQAPAP